MLVSQILRTKGDLVFTVRPFESLAAVANLLNDRNVGALVVVEAERVVGIISERDLVRAVAADGPGAFERETSNYMTAEVLFADPGETVDSLLGRMTDRRIRHLPVCVDERLIGLISIGDLVKAKISEAQAEADNLKAYIGAG